MNKLSGKIKKITIIGLGVIGGSWGLAVKRVRPDITVCGVDLDSASLQKAQQADIIDCWSLNPAEAVADADVVVIACPLSKIVAVAKEILPHMKSRAILKDVGSVKESIINAIESTLPADIDYVPGHPMAGSEKTGISGADTFLFENAAYILTPFTRTTADALAVIEELVTCMGARTLLMSPAEHDMQVATVSHLPHLVASVLVNSAGAISTEYPDLFLLAAGGFRDTTRIASSNPEMWRDVSLGNRQAILEAIEIFEKQLQNCKDALNAKDAHAVFNIFSRAKKWREQVPAGMKGILPELYEIVVVVPDKPGMIGEIANLLGENKINIIDIEILRVREGAGGSIRFGFLEKNSAIVATELLRQKGFGVNPRFDM